MHQSLISTALKQALPMKVESHVSSHLVAIAFGNKNIDKKWKMLWLRNWKTNYLLLELIILALQNSQQTINCLANWNRIYRRWSTCLVNLPQMLIFHQRKMLFHIIFLFTLSFTCLICLSCYWNFIVAIGQNLSFNQVVL